MRAAPPAARSLTDTLLQERRAQQKLEESSVGPNAENVSFFPPGLLLKRVLPLQYAGILRLDHINQEVNIL